MTKGLPNNDALPSHVADAVAHLEKVVDACVIKHILASGQLNGLNPEIQAGANNEQIAQNNYAAIIPTDRSRTT